MFNLFLNTDNKYKNKYRSIMFNLKDPKNKGLFYRVIGGDVTPSKLVRLSPEELLSREISEWRPRETTEVLEPNPRPPSGQTKPVPKQETAPDVDMEESPPLSDGDEQEEPRPSPAPAPAPAVKNSQVNVASPVPDIFSSMLKDTTAEHRAHLFDLNCKICTGQKSAEEEPPPKKPKPSAPAVAKKVEVKAKQEPRPSKVGGSTSDSAPVAAAGSEAPVTESPASPEDTTIVTTSTQSFPTPVTIPAVSSVSITRRDPRTAGYRPPVTVAPAPATVSSSSEPPVTENKAALPPPPPPPPSAPKSILLKPAASPDSRFFAGSGASGPDSHSPQESETAMFLSSQEMMWKGFINMHTVAKFVTKAYLVSGSFEHLKEDLPDTIHIGGRISPHTVWDYVGKLKTSLSKELCLIRFHPATEEEEVAYISLFSYFSSRRRFGVVANNNRRIKDLYLIPLSAKDPLPSKLLPFDGPGLEPARPNLLLGLVICQKERKRSAAPPDGSEKRSKLQAQDPDETGLPKLPGVSRPEVKQEKPHLYNLEASVSTTPPGSPPPIGASESSSGSLITPTVLSLMSSLKGSAASSSGKDSPSSSTSSSSTPLQTILKTLFGKKKQDSEASLSPSEHISAEAVVPPVPLLDPIVQQFGQISKEKEIEEDEDDRPYDPEEEYDPAMGYGTEAPMVTGKAFEASKPSEVATSTTNAEVDDVAYDPEDETIFDEVKGGVEVPGQTKAKPSSEGEGGASTLTEQQKMLDELNKQIEEEKRRLEEQEESIRQQRAAGVTIADALLVPPTKSLLANSQLLQLGKKVEELVAKTPTAPVINQRRDPRQSRDPRQAAANRRLTSDSVEKEEASTGGPAEEPAPLQVDITQQAPTQSAVETQTESVPFLDTTESTEVAIPLLGETIEPEMEDDTFTEPMEKGNKDSTKVEIESNPYTAWPNSASILKAKELSDMEKSHEPAVPDPVQTQTPTLNPASYYTSHGLLPTTSLKEEGVHLQAMKWDHSVSPHLTSLGGQEDHLHMLTVREPLHLNTGVLLRNSEVLIPQISLQGREVLHLHTLVGHEPTHLPTSQTMAEEDSPDSILTTILLMEGHCDTVVLCSPRHLRVPFKSQTEWVTALTLIGKTTGGMAQT
ncbi:hypothetical protein JZ751_017774 [Albula glossodonta]|uniref:TFIIS central domain-containing protein n=1 Tax=Albula glossodonta TaxID=121402 RepID=A0A8T2PPD0_9TELE|nr:hypothetical protein JZ751_017774 [Albula glossodonta]